VFGRVRGREFHHKKVHTLVRPWFLQEVRGVVAAAGTGSEIRIRLGLTVPNALVFAVMFVVVLVGAGGLVPAIVAPGSWPLAGWLSSSVAAVIFVVVYAQERLFWVRDNAFLLWFLEDQLNARRVDA
jgi:hypothetical protein